MNASSSPEASAAIPSAEAGASALPTVVTSTVPLDDAAGHLAVTAADVHGTTETTEPAEEGGLPQLRTEYWPGQIVWLLVIFLVFYLLLGKLFAPRLRKVIDTRGATIAEDLANARANRDEAEAQAKEAAAETAAAHAAAKKLAAEAVARSNAEIARLQAAEDEKLNARLGEADARIRAARDDAMGHVRDIAAETASVLVEKLTGKAATAAALKAALGKVS
jgi:F-type H+-transporting ATPase subunit b